MFLLASIIPTTIGEGSNQIMILAGQFGIKPHLLLAQIVNFCLVAWILYVLVLRPVRKSLDSRARTIDEGLRKSEEAVQTLKKAHGEADDLLAEAQKKAAEIIGISQKQAAELEAKSRAITQKESAELLQKARQDAKAEYAASLAASKEGLAKVVVELSEKALGEELTPDQRTRFAQKAAETFNK
jgi:F-type H+-transporting ATPase subunit b